MTRNEAGVFRRCGCTEIVVDEHGNPVLTKAGKPKRRELGTDCPKLKRNTKHGTWWYQIDVAAPRGSGKTRARIRKGGFEGKEEAITARSLIRGKGDSAARRKVPTSPVTVEQYAERWLKGRRKLREATRVSYSGHIANYIVPYLGEIQMRDLDLDDVEAMFDGIEARNQEIAESLRINPRGRRHENLTKEQREAGARRELRRVAGPATVQRIRATGRKMYNDALKAKVVTGPNPFSLIELESGEAPEPVLWTAQTEAKWRATGEVPGSTMVWTAEQTGAFLDAAAGHGMYDLFDLASYTGMRRGELCGLRWSDVDLATGVLNIRVQLTLVSGVVSEGPTKSSAGKRSIPLDAEFVATLRAIRKRQMEDRMLWGALWVDSGRVFTKENGEQLNPDRVYDAFKQISTKADLPPVSLHGMRRGAGSMAVASGQPMKAVAALLGHRDEKVTSKHYVAIADEMKRDLVQVTRSAIPRKAPNGTGQAV